MIAFNDKVNAQHDMLDEAGFVMQEKHSEDTVTVFEILEGPTFLFFFRKNANSNSG